MMRAFSVGLFAALLAHLASTAVAQTPRSDRFEWSGELASSGRVWIRNVNGNVLVQATSGNRVEVQATKVWRRGDPSSVRIVARPSPHGIVICGLWTRTSDCREDAEVPRGRTSTNPADRISVEILVKLPRSTPIYVVTINGDIEIDDATSTVYAASTNGNVLTRSSAGAIVATTINGAVTAQLQEPYDANLDARTTFGKLRLEVPVVVSGPIRAGQLRGTIGRGGRRIRLSSVNGDVIIEKRE
jgi:hypothetical protein